MQSEESSTYASIAASGSQQSAAVQEGQRPAHANSSADLPGEGLGPDNFARVLAAVMVTADNICPGVTQRLSAADFSAVVSATARVFGPNPPYRALHLSPPVNVAVELVDACHKLMSAGLPSISTPQRSKPVAQGAASPAKTRQARRQSRRRRSNSAPKSGDPVAATAAPTQSQPLSRLERLRRNLRKKATRALKSPLVSRINENLVDKITADSIRARAAAFVPGDGVTANVEYGPGSLALLGFLDDSNYLEGHTWAAMMDADDYRRRCLSALRSAKRTQEGRKEDSAYAAFAPMAIAVQQSSSEHDIHVPMQESRIRETILAAVGMNNGMFSQPGTVMFHDTKIVELRFPPSDKGRIGRVQMEFHVPSTHALASLGSGQVGLNEDGSNIVAFRLRLAFAMTREPASASSIRVWLWRATADRDWAKNSGLSGTSEELVLLKKVETPGGDGSPSGARPSAVAPCQARDGTGSQRVRDKRTRARTGTAAVDSPRGTKPKQKRR